MSTIGSGVLIGVLTAVFTALLTYFISTLTGRGYIKKAIKEGFNNHVKIHHKTDLAVMIESKELKLQGEFEKAIKKVHTSVTKAHERIDKTNELVNRIAIDIASINTSQDYIVKTLEKIERGLS